MESKWHKARELEIQYNFAWRKYSGSFPAIVDERYCRLDGRILEFDSLQG